MDEHRETLAEQESGPDVDVHHTKGCGLCGRTDQHTHTQSDWRAHVDGDSDAGCGLDMPPAAEPYRPNNQTPERGKSMPKPKERLTGKPREGKDWARREPYAHEAERAKKRPDLDDLRRGRWYDENPIKSNTSTGGGAVASIEEVRAAIMRAIEKMNEGLGAIQQGRADQEEAQGQLMAATEGSGQADVSTANGLLAQAVNTLDEVSQQVSAAISESQDVANRL